MDDNVIRDYLQRYLDWHEAHAHWTDVFKGIPVKEQGKRPKGAPHSPWEILEHIRLAQHDILDFCRNPKYAAMDWPADYWPEKTVPPNAHAWGKSVKAFGRDLKEMQQLVANPKTNLEKPILHGSGQTILREALLVADHNAYHLGEFVLVRRLLGCWKET
jgi:DinB superfamily